MSYRDLRSLTESLRTLGYPRLVSIENFREPNFALVAEILRWLTQRYDPNADFPMDVNSEKGRVIFIKTIAKFMVTKGGIRLNTKKLYRADGHSVKELLKLTSVLTAALQATVNEDKDDDAVVDLSKFDLSNHSESLKNTRLLASQITTRGAALHELLGHEVDLREGRADAIERPLDVDEIEAGVNQTIEVVKREVERTKSRMDNLGADEKNLTQKIDVKKAEFERNNKRLRSLEGYRPPYMDEYEKYERDLQVQYAEYVDRFRNLSFLEHQLERLDEQDKFVHPSEKAFASAFDQAMAAAGVNPDELGYNPHAEDDEDLIFDGSAGIDSDDEFMDNRFDGHVEGDIHGGDETDSEGDDSSNSERFGGDDDNDDDDLFPDGGVGRNEFSDGGSNDGTDDDF